MSNKIAARGTLAKSTVQRREAGRKGGRKTLERYSPERLRSIGAQGGKAWAAAQGKRGLSEWGRAAAAARWGKRRRRKGPSRARAR